MAPGGRAVGASWPERLRAMVPLGACSSAATSTLRIVVAEEEGEMSLLAHSVQANVVPTYAAPNAGGS